MATHVRSRGLQQTQPSTALRLKWGREQRKLKAKLEVQLCNDLKRCFSDAVHPDVTLVTPTEEILVHRAILYVRSPFLYRELEEGCENQRVYISNISCELLKSHLQKVYSAESVDEEEATLVALLRQKKAIIQSGQFSDNGSDPEFGVSSPSSMEANNHNSTFDSDAEGNGICVEHCPNGNDCEGFVEDSLTIHIGGDNNVTSDSEDTRPPDSIVVITDDSLSISDAAAKATTPVAEHFIAICTDSAESTDANQVVDEKDEQSSVVGSEGSDRSRTLIRRDTFDLIDPSLVEDDIVPEDDDDDGEEEIVVIHMDDVNPRVVWEIGGDVLTKSQPEPNTIVCIDKPHDDDQDVVVESTTSNHENGTGVIMVPKDINCNNSVGHLNHNGDASNNGNDVHTYNKLVQVQEKEISEVKALTSLNYNGVKPKRSHTHNLAASEDTLGRPEPDEIIYLDQISSNGNRKSLVLECGSAIHRRSNTEDSLVDLQNNMRRSSSKLFSPDSIISDRSPLLERASGFTHNTVHILPILTDYERMNIEETDEPPVERKRTLSRRSSESLSPEADSLNVECGKKNGLTTSPVANVNSSMSVVTSENFQRKRKTPSSVTVNLGSEKIAANNGKPNSRTEGNKIDNIPILSGYIPPVEEAVKDKAHEDSSGKGSFFVFIDVSEDRCKVREMPSLAHLTVDARKRVTSGTSEDESLSVNKSLSVDTSRKDSLSEDDTQSDRSPKLGTSPKNPASVYMFIEAGTSPKDVPNVRRAHHVRRASGEYSSSAPISKGHVRRLSQSRDCVVPPPPLQVEPESPHTRNDSSFDSLLKPRSIKVQDQKSEKTSSSLLSPDQDDDMETLYSEFSDYFSHERSNSVSATSPDDDDSGPSRGPCSKLGEDLQRMFLEEINTDVVVRVNGKDIKAHKCILSSRCSYFAAMLSGGWLESSGNVINLQGFSYTAVHFALCHIYSGATAVPNEVDITELASIADMLGLEGLRDVVALTLKAKYCHFFHKPCSKCITGVLECLPICANYGIEELYEKCIRWVTRHMARTWSTKVFATLPEELLNKCYRAAKAEVTTDSVLEIIMTCDKLMATLPHVKWSDSVFGLCSKLLEACTIFMAKNLHLVLVSKSFLALGKGQSWNVNTLEETIMVALENLTPDSACSSYVVLADLLGAEETGNLNGEDPEMIENFVELLQKIQRQVERFLIHNANRVVHCPSWAKLTPAMQKRIKDAAVIVFEFGKPTAPPPRLSSLNRGFNRGNVHSPAEHSESSTTSSSSGRTTGSKRPAQSAAVSIPKPSSRPLTAPGNSAPTLRIRQGGGTRHTKKSPIDQSTRPLTPNSDIRSPSSVGSQLNGAHNVAASSPRANRLSDLPGALLRKSLPRGDRAANPRPKSWPTKEKPPHTTKSKVELVAKETKTVVNTVTLRNTTKSTTRTAIVGRPRSAVYSSETSSENAVKPCRSMTSSSLRDTKSSASKRVISVESMEIQNKNKPTDKPGRSHTNALKKGYNREDLKLHTSRRTVERSGIKVGVGNKG